MTVMADDTQFAADAPTPTGKQQHSSPAASAHSHCPWTTNLPASTASPWVAAAACRHRLHTAGCSATAMHPV